MTTNNNNNTGNEVEREKMMILLAAFSKQQYDRYEIYRRSKFGKAVVKRLLYHQIGVHVNDKVALAISASAKVLVGEVIETALDYKAQLEATEGTADSISPAAALQPKHIREAVRRLRANCGDSLAGWEGQRRH